LTAARPGSLPSANRIKPQTDRPTHSVQRGGEILLRHFRPADCRRRPEWQLRQAKILGAFVNRDVGRDVCFPWYAVGPSNREGLRQAPTLVWWGPRARSRIRESKNLGPALENSRYIAWLRSVTEAALLLGDLSGSAQSHQQSGFDRPW